MKKEIKIIIVDDSPEFIEGMKLLFSTSPEYKIIEICHNGDQLVNSDKLSEADIICIDIEMPEINGIEVAKKINYLTPSIPLIALTMYFDTVYLTEIIGAGFKGFIHKPDISNTLFNALETVLNQDYFFPGNIKI